VVCLLQCRGRRRQELRVRNIGTMFGRRPRSWRELWTKSLPILAAITSVSEASETLNDYGSRASPGNLAIFTAIRRASSDLILIKVLVNQSCFKKHRLFTHSRRGRSWRMSQS
jgi:hypothetical protein